MKATLKTITIICIVAAAVLALCLAMELRAGAKLAEENNAMRQQLNPMDQLLADNQRLLSLVAEAEDSHARPNGPVEALPATDERTKELSRLRAEVEALRHQTKEMEALRADTRQAHAALETARATQGASRPASSGNSTSSGGSAFEVLSAEYWTDKTNMDVAAELRERIRGDSLKAVANNNLKGDPDFGEVKRLTVVYRVGGVLMTNEFREGEVIMLPKE